MKEKLQPFHIAILVYTTQAGIVVFTLPRQLADYFGTNGWLFLLVCYLLSAGNIGLIALVYKLGGGRPIFEILEQSLPKLILYPVYVSLASVWLMFGCMIGKKYILLFQMISFPTTNPMFFKLAVDVLIYLLLAKGIYTISKAATLFFWMTIWMSLLLLWFFPSFRWERLTPFLLQGGHDQIKGGIELYSAYLGYELSILFFPYIDKRKKAMLAIQLGNTLLTLNYLSLSLICFGFFSWGQLKKLIYPLLDLLAYIQLPFIERLENLLYGFFLFLILITVVMYWWAAEVTVMRIFPRIKKKGLTITLITVSYCISFIPKTLDEVVSWITNLGYVTIGIAFGLPIVLILVLLIQRQGRESRA
ncbi:germination protein GerHB [Paenibacillus albidus]|uniref:Germination protein GerHB n=1 Tax=Paenibacillus albidus TaxID=2041023 RepID=A0A917BWT1_9BACL|nr:GerAB/ArcD/ProY family transporter [Paenibacillus albidus]GGF59684.1 germination protein GerHB [Paenibacillus albidus]